jgi:hypothetical protein
LPSLSSLHLASLHGNNGTFGRELLQEALLIKKDKKQPEQGPPSWGVKAKVLEGPGDPVQLAQKG